MLTGGPVVFPVLAEAAPPLPLPPAAAAVRWLWLRHLGCQEGRGTARGHSQELDNRGAHNVVCMYCQWVVEGRGRGGGRTQRIDYRERVAHISNANT